MIGWKPVLLRTALSFLCSSVCFSFVYLLTKSCVDGRKSFHGRFAQNGGDIKCKECGFISVCNWPSEFVAHSLELPQAIFSEFIPREEVVLKPTDSEAEAHVHICHILVLSTGKVQISMCLSSVKGRLKIAHLMWLS